MLLGKWERMIAGKCWDCVLAVLLQMVVEVVVDLQNCVLDVCLVEMLVFLRGFRQRRFQRRR